MSENTQSLTEPNSVPQSETEQKYKASAKVMRSYDYCHFEVCLSSDQEMTTKQVDDMRKEAARLVDKSVEQYKTMKASLSRYPDEDLQRRAKVIKENFPRSEWTDEQKALVKKAEDNAYWCDQEYNYEDEWWD